MKLQFKRMAVFAFALALLLSGCGKTPENPTEHTQEAETQPLTDAQWYAQARENFEKENNMQLTYTLTETRVANGRSFGYNLSGTASVSNRGKENMLAVVNETLKYGDFQFAYMEMYRGGSTYVQVFDSGFSAAATPQEFLARQMPAVLLDETLYERINAVSGESMALINFNEPKALEKWLPCSEGAELISAGATVKLNSKNQLLETLYRAKYRNNGVEFEVEATVHVTTPATLELEGSIPQYVNVIAVLDYIGAPKMLLQTVGAVYTAKEINCTVTETIKSEAIPLEYTQNSKYKLTGSGEGLNAEAMHETSLSDDRGNITTKTQLDTFQKGVYTTVENGGEPTIQDEITDSVVRLRFEDAVLSAVFAPKYMLNAKIEDCGEYYQLNFYGNSSFKKDLMGGITYFLDVDLDAKAENIEDVAATGYLTVDKATGLPTAMGLAMERIHTLASAQQRLIYSLEQTLCLLPVTES